MNTLDVKQTTAKEMISVVLMHSDLAVTNLCVGDNWKFVAKC